MRSVRSVVTREILFLLVLLATVLMVGAFVVQYQIEKKTSETLMNGFSQAVQVEQENLLLQILLSRPDDLNLYFQALKGKFPKIRMCLDLNPKIPGVRDFCGPATPRDWASLSIMGNRNFAIRFKALQRAASDILFEPWHLSLWLFAIAACALSALYLRLRLRTLLSNPVISTQNAIEHMLNGERQFPVFAPESVTEWKKIEDCLQQLVVYLQRLEKAEYEAGQIKTARQVTHDVKSPLSLLRIATQVYTDIPAEKRAVMRSAVDRIEDIITSLLPDHEKKEGFWDVGHLIEQVVDEKRFSVPANIEFVIELDDEKPQVAYLEPAQFKRIVSNILNNSVEAMPGKGRITVRVVPDQGWALVQFLDTGKGISALNMKQIHLGMSVDKPNGQGLGLSHTRQHLESWGGQLDLSSAEGIGTVLTLKLRQEVARSKEISVASSQKRNKFC